ncbi:claudin-34-like [Meriones unguiculatus]|uniref:claudin-34-like n=1 Tax=Meriones unguiculatus TaxID=10047 RepID=UPI000B4F2DEC|nr:claudin-34-like [Meriones unguiculatus]
MVTKNRCNRQMGGLALTTMACIICCVSMELPHWRVWYFQDPAVSKRSIAFVGMWRVCVFHHDENFSIIRNCHRYSYHDTFVPLDIRMIQQLLLVASILGLVGKITTIISLWDVCMGTVQVNSTYNPFALSGILNIISSTFVFIAVLFNYVFIKRKEGIAFPPSFHMPSNPDSQETGGAMALAIIAAILFLLSGIILLCSKIATVKPGHPDL